MVKAGIAAAVIVTAILTPVLTAWLAKRKNTSFKNPTVPEMSR